MSGLMYLLKWFIGDYENYAYIPISHKESDEENI
jgi:hypothetical protein